LGRERRESISIVPLSPFSEITIPRTENPKEDCKKNHVDTKLWGSVPPGKRLIKARKMDAVIRSPEERASSLWEEAS